MTAPPCTDEAAEILLNEYVDGELNPARQPDLFAHLATCADCRSQFDALLAFRLGARQEALAVPATADAALFARLDGLRRSTNRRAAPDRRADRAPLGGALRQRVSVGAMLAVAAVAIVVATVLSPTETPAAPQERVVEAVLEDGSLYLIDPGITVEAERTEATP